MSGNRFVFISHSDFNLHRFRLPLLKSLVVAGNQVWAMVPPGEHDEDWRKHGISHQPYRLRRGSLNPFHAIGVVREMVNHLSQISPDVVHTFTLLPNVLGSIAAQQSNVPCIINSVTGLGTYYRGAKLSPHDRLFSSVIEHVYRFAARKVEKVIFQNPDDREHYIAHGLIDAEQAVLIRSSGVDVAHFSAATTATGPRRRFRKLLGLDEQVLLVTMVARLLRPKGVLEFLQTARRITGEFAKVHFVLIGAPDPGNPASFSEQELQEFSGAGGVSIMGHCSNVLEWLRASDIFVLPSYYREGVPRAVLEAMAVGLPVVTTNMPGCREAVQDGVNGYLIPARDLEALVDRVRLLVQSADLRSRMSSEGIRIVRDEFSIERVIDAHLKLYETLLQPQEVSAQAL